MFHVMLVFPIFIALAVLISFLLFGIFMIVLSAVGGASSALLIKNKAVKRISFIGSSILTLVGLVCLLPIVTMYAQLPGNFLAFATVGSFICIGILAIAGIKLSMNIQNRIGKSILVVIFCLILVAATSLAVFIPVLGRLFTSN